MQQWRYSIQPESTKNNENCLEKNTNNDCEELEINNNNIRVRSLSRGGLLKYKNARQELFFELSCYNILFDTNRVGTHARLRDGWLEVGYPFCGGEGGMMRYCIRRLVYDILYNITIILL